MEHEGKALAADETDSHHHRAGIASVHTRAFITWLAIFPMVAVGMTVLGAVAADWHPLLRALALTLVVVPIAVYFAVPRLLVLERRLSGAVRGRSRRRASAGGATAG